MDMTETTQQNDPATEAAYARYLADLDDCTLFTYARLSHAGALSPRGRGWMKQSDEATGRLLLVLGMMVTARRSLLDVAVAVARSCNPHASRAEWCAKLFETAGHVLRGEYDDVERRSGPESVRQKDCVRPYSRTEKLIVLELLKSLCVDYVGLGWAAERCAAEEGVLGVIKTIVGR